MKTISHIFLSVLLSVTILFIGNGVSIMRCSHTGTLKVMTVLEAEGMGGMDCDMNSSCMTTEHVELSPTNIAQSVSVDFHVVQPVLAVLSCLATEWLQPMECKALVQPIHVVWKSPPRAYLNLIRVLLI